MDLESGLGGIKRYASKREYIAVKDSDVDNLHYFPSNIGDAKEVIEFGRDGMPTYKEVFKYNIDGGGTSEILSYDFDSKEWRR